MPRRIFKLAIAALLVAGALAVVALQHWAAAELRGQNQGLRAQLEQQRQLEAENLRLSRLVAELRPETPDRLQDELARLRGEMDRLRAQRAEWEKLCAENGQLRAELGDGVRPLIGKDDWTYVGYADPEAALQSTLWAWASADPALIVASLRPVDRAAWGNLSDEEVAARLARKWRLSSGFQILGQKKVSDDEIAVIVNAYPDRPDIANAELHFNRIGSEWKIDCDLTPGRAESGRREPKLNGAALLPSCPMKTAKAGADANGLAPGRSSFWALPLGITMIIVTALPSAMRLSCNSVGPSMTTRAPL